MPQVTHSIDNKKASMDSSLIPAPIKSNALNKSLNKNLNKSLNDAFESKPDSSYQIAKQKLSSSRSMRKEKLNTFHQALRKASDANEASSKRNDERVQAASQEHNQANTSIKNERSWGNKNPLKNISQDAKNQDAQVDIKAKDVLENDLSQDMKNSNLVAEAQVADIENENAQADAEKVISKDAGYAEFLDMLDACMQSRANTDIMNNLALSNLGKSLNADNLAQDAEAIQGNELFSISAKLQEGMVLNRNAESQNLVNPENLKNTASKDSQLIMSLIEEKNTSELNASPTLKLGNLQAMLQKVEEQMGPHKIPAALEQLLSGNKNNTASLDPELQNLLQSMQSVGVEDKSKNAAMANINTLNNTLQNNQENILANAMNNVDAKIRGHEKQEEIVENNAPLIEEPINKFPEIKSLSALKFRDMNRAEAEMIPAIKSENKTAQNNTDGNQNLFKEGVLGAETKSEALFNKSLGNENSVNFAQAFEGARFNKGVATSNKTQHSHLSSADAAILQEISKKMSTAFMRSDREVHIQLRPEQLGQVHIALEKQDDKLSAKINVANENVKQIVEQNLSQLRDSLSSQGITIQNIEVSVSLFAQAGEQERQQMESNSQGPKFKQGADNTSPLWQANEAHDESDTGRRLGYNTLEFIG